MHVQGHVFKVYQIQTKYVDCMYMYTVSRAAFCDMVSKDWGPIGTCTCRLCESDIIMFIMLHINCLILSLQHGKIH